MQMVRDTEALEAIANEQGVEIEEFSFYGSMSDVEQMLETALNGFASEFDTEAIIDRVIGWYVPKSCYMDVVSIDTFWQIVEECELTHVDRSRTR